MDNAKNWYALLLSILTVATAEEAIIIVDPDVELSASIVPLERIRDPRTIARRTKVKENRHVYLPVGSKCKHPGCNNEIMPYRVHCKDHLEKHVKYLEKEMCTIEGCHEIEYARGFCSYHYMKSKEVKCKTENCVKIANRRGYCSKCFIRLRKEGSINEVDKKNTNNVLDSDR